jgi:hypothetical protein
MSKEKLNTENLTKPTEKIIPVQAEVSPLTLFYRNVKFTRVWAMPSMWTFTIKPIKELLQRYEVGQGWIDPFAGENSPAEITNDLNPDRPTKYHLHAKDFLDQLSGSYEGALFDPPYSLQQVKECYNNIGLELLSREDANYFPGYIKDLIAPKIKSNGIVISCGWSSGGFGLKRGFELIEILLIPHGGHHNDTIVTVERKIQAGLFDPL